MQSIPTLSEETNRARVMAGMKGGPFFSNPIRPPAMTFVEGYPSESIAKYQSGPMSAPTPSDSWKDSRR